MVIYNRLPDNYMKEFLFIELYKNALLISINRPAKPFTTMKKITFKPKIRNDVRNLIESAILFNPGHLIYFLDNPIITL